jgi:ATP/maltotriose-dependent transcriptional regulator MalT
VLVRLLSIADERGEPYSYTLMRLHLCELELRIGDWEAAQTLLDEWAESSDRVMWPMYERCRALLAVGRGLPDEAERWAVKAIAASEATGMRWDLLEATRARGVASLLARRPERAAESLRAVWSHVEQEGLKDPGTFPAAPDLVEALVEVGEPNEARAVTERLKELGAQQEHPWAQASAKRCAGLADGDATLLADAADDFQRLGLRFDCARTLLVLGRTERRRKKWGAARRSLERAAAAFGEIGSTGWADRSRSELDRIGGRRPAAGKLTPSERRVVELAARGLSNKEIARELVVTTHTIEAHLSHAYEKLGVSSRSQLAGRLNV